MIGNLPPLGNAATPQQLALAIHMLARQIGSSSGPASTDDLPEGSTNLYFTNERVDDRVAGLIQNGPGITWSYNDVANTLTPTVTVSGGTPAGSTTQIQYNNAGAFGASDKLTWAEANASLGVGNVGSHPTTTGKILLRGGTSGVTTVQVAGAAGTYNFNLPLTAGSSGQPLLSGGGGSTLMSFGTLSQLYGGTGASNLSGILQGNGAGSPYTAVSGSTVGQVLRVTGANAYAWGALDLANVNSVTGVLPIANGGTGANSAAGALTALGAVAKAGDTMSGDLTIAKNTPAISFNKSAGGQDINILGSTAGVTRWNIILGNGTAESGSNAGSNFDIYRYSDVGAVIDNPLTINRASGAVTLRGSQDASAAAAGRVGEVIEAAIAVGSALGLTTNVQTVLTSIVLTPGDWDITVQAMFVGGATTRVTYLVTGYSTTTQVVNSPVGSYSANYWPQSTIFNTGITVISLPVSPGVVRVAGNTTYNMIVMGTFDTSTLSAWGRITARRRR